MRKKIQDFLIRDFRTSISLWQWLIGNKIYNGEYEYVAACSSMKNVVSVYIHVINTILCYKAQEFYLFERANPKAPGQFVKFLLH